MTTKKQKLDLSGKDLEGNPELLQDALVKYPSVTDLDISNTKIQTYPDTLLQYKKLTTLDIRNNPFKNFETLVEQLTKYPNLSDLKIDLTEQNQVLLILSQIPKLIMLNGKSTKDAVTIVDVEEKDIEHISLQANLNFFTDIVNRLNIEDDKEFVENFQRELNEEAQKIKNCLNNNVPNYIYANIVIQSQFLIQKFLAKKFISRLNDDDKETANLLLDNIFENGNNLVELVNNLYPKIEEKTETLRTQLEEAWKAADEITDYEEKYNLANKEKQLISDEKKLIQTKLEKLENENKIITQKLIKNAKDICNYTLTNNNNNNITTMNDNNNLNNNNNNISNNQLNTATASHDKTKFNRTTSNNEKSSMFNNNNNNYMDNNMTTLVHGNVNRKLTIKMTKDVMNEIYNSKVLFDKKCYDSKLPRETMEQHMYTYLNQKYGLKNLIIEWASLIINAIKLYSNQDSEINLFGKILRNEQEEDSRLVLTKLRNTISELLEYYLKSKNPFKSANDIKKMLNKKKEGILTEEEWKGIIYFIYDNKDAQNIESKINNFINKMNSRSTDNILEYLNNNSGNINNNNNINNNSTLLANNTPNKKYTREELLNMNRPNEEMNINYKDFIKLVSDHQIRNREKYLKNFVKIFRKIDTNSDGILDEGEFLNLVKCIPCCKDNYEDYTMKFLSIIDPFNNKKITFSECVSLFSMEMIEDKDGKNEPISVLDKISADDSFN